MEEATGTNNSDAKTVFEVNSRAVTALQVGNHPEAISHLQRAMTWIRDIVHDPAQPGFTMVPIPGYGDQVNRDVVDEVSILSVPSVIDQAVFPSPSLDTSTPFQFFDGVFLTPYLNYEGTKGLRLTCAFVLYNLGFCFHHREVVNGTMNPDKLRVATKFYSRGLRILDGTAHDTRQDDMIVLLLALFSNLGQLSTRLGDTEDCRNCFCWIQSLLANPRTRLLAQTRPDVAFFYQNNLLWVENNFNKAPAA